MASTVHPFPHPPGIRAIGRMGNWKSEPPCAGKREKLPQGARIAFLGRPMQHRGGGVASAGA